MDGELRVGRGEDLAEVEFVEVGAEVLVPHPPVAVVFELIIQFFLEALVVIPGFVFVCKLAGPLSLAPGVSDSNKEQAVNFSDLLNAVGMVKQNTRVAHAVFEVSILVLYSVGAAEEEAKRVVLLKVLPELTSFNCFCNLRSSEMELFRHSACEVNHCFRHLATI